jgi:hypothetical protein
VSDAVREWIFDDGHGKGTKSGLPLLPPPDIANLS